MTPHLTRTASMVTLVLCLQVHAGEPASGVDTSNWLCNFCNYSTGWFGAFDIGPGYLSDTDLKFADYRGLEDKGGFISIYGDIHYRNENGRYFDLYTRDLGTHARQLEMRGGQQGRFEFRLAYREIPKYRGFGTQTVHQGTGGNTLVLPPAWVRGRTTAGMSALDASLSPVTLDTLRKTIDAGLSFKISGKWRYQLDFQHTQKNGTRPFGAGVFTIQSTHFPVPVDFTTNRVDMGLEYSGQRTRLRFGFSSSYFNNANASITWENPFRPVGTTEILRAALEPDSDFHQFSLTGNFTATPRLRFSGRAAIGRSRQDEPFLAYSSNPEFNALQLPRPSLGGKIDSSTLNLAGRANARLSRKLRLSVRLKIDERDNQTPVDLYTPVITDLELRPPTPNRPYSFKRKQYSAELTYRAQPWANFNAGVKRKDYHRTLQSVRTTEELSWWGEINISRWATAQLRLRFETSERDISPYIQVSDPGLQENILLRKFNLADRDRERMLIELDLSPFEKLSVSLSYAVAEDSYQQSLLGLLNSDEESFSMDLGVAIRPRLSLHAFLTQDYYDSEISGAISPVATPWKARTRDRFTTYGFGLNGQINRRLKLGFDYVSSTSKGRIATDSGAGEAPFPELKTDLRNVRMHLSYRLNQQWGWTLSAEHEKYASQDWQIDDLGNDGISAILTLGEVSPNYSATVVRLLANYTF